MEPSIEYPISSSPLFNAIHDCHNNALKFKILKDAKVDWEQQKGFKGVFQRTIYKGIKIAKSSKWLIIYYNKREKVPLRDLPNVSDTIVRGMVNLAVEISRRYNLTIDPTPLPFSSNRPEIKTPFLSANNFIDKEAKAVYPPPSPIELTGENAVKNAWNLTETLATLLEATKLEIENKAKHQQVLEQMSQTLSKMNDNLKPKLNVWQRIYKFINHYL